MKFRFFIYISPVSQLLEARNFSFLMNKSPTPWIVAGSEQLLSKYWNIWEMNKLTEEYNPEKNPVSSNYPFLAIVVLHPLPTKGLTLFITNGWFS